MGGQRTELALRQAEYICRSHTAHCRIARGLVEQCHLAEILTRAELREPDVVSIVFMHHLGLTAEDDVQTVSQVALVKHLFAGLEMLVGDAHGTVDLQLDQFGRQQQVERP